MGLHETLSIKEDVRWRTEIAHTADFSLHEGVKAFIHDVTLRIGLNSEIDLVDLIFPEF
jgi:hypothetical protein